MCCAASCAYQFSWVKMVNCCGKLWTVQVANNVMNDTTKMPEMIVESYICQMPDIWWPRETLQINSQAWPTVIGSKMHNDDQ